MSFETEEGLQSSVKELVKEALLAEMQRFQKAAAANKQTQSMSNKPEGTYIHNLDTMGFDISRQTLPWIGMNRGCSVYSRLELYTGHSPYSCAPGMTWHTPLLHYDMPAEL